MQQPVGHVSDDSPVRVCLVTDDEAVEAAVRLSCARPNEMTVYSLEGVVNDCNALSDYGREIVQAAASSDAVLLEWDLQKAPVINTLCYHVRQSVRAPLLALCRGGQDAYVAALAAGADDVMSFPLYMPLLQVRIVAYRRLVQAAWRAAPRTETSTPLPGDERDVLQYGELRLDRSARRFFVRGREVELTHREFALLEYLLAHADVACSRDQILDHVWGINFDTGTNMVDVYVYFLRRKLESYGLKGWITTVRGFGYRFGMSETEVPES